MNTQEYLDEAKSRLGLDSDYALAKAMKWSTSQISHYRNKRNALGDIQAAKLALVLGKQPIEIIAAANAERTSDEEEKAFWLALAAHAKAEMETARRDGEPLKGWWPGAESNHRHADFQSAALPTELPGHARPRW